MTIWLTECSGWVLRGARGVFLVQRSLVESVLKGNQHACPSRRTKYFLSRRGGEPRCGSGGGAFFPGVGLMAFDQPRTGGRKSFGLMVVGGILLVLAVPTHKNQSFLCISRSTCKENQHSFTCRGGITKKFSESKVGHGRGGKSFEDSTLPRSLVAVSQRGDGTASQFGRGAFFPRVGLMAFDQPRAGGWKPFGLIGGVRFIGMGAWRWRGVGIWVGL